jgi:magnesium transporter
MAVYPACIIGLLNSLLTKRYNPPGTAPGTLQTSVIRSQRLPFKLRLIEYSTDTLVEREDISITQCMSFLQNDNLTWIHAQGEITPEILKELGSSFGLQPLALEDVINTGQRP